MLPLVVTSSLKTFLPRRSSHLTGVYNPKAFIPHAASLCQAFAHCTRFPTAASRRSLGSVAVPMWPFSLSARLPVKGLVGRYPANCLIGRRPLPKRRPLRRTFGPQDRSPKDVIWYYPTFRLAIPGSGVGYLRITHPFAALLLELPPVSRSTCMY